MHISRKKHQSLLACSAPNLILLLSGCGGASSKDSNVRLKDDVTENSNENSVELNEPAEIVELSSFSGTALKGPLKDAIAFLDYNKNGFPDLGEPSAKTDENGNFEFTDIGDIEYVSVITNSETIDMVNGNNLAGLILEAPITAHIVSPFTTLLVNSSLSKNKLSVAFGLPQHIDLENFNPFPDDAHTEDAIQYEIIAKQIVNTTAILTSLLDQEQISDEQGYKHISSVLAKKVTEELNQGDSVSFLEISFLTSIVESTMELEIAVNESSLFDSGLEISNIVSAVQSINSEIASLSDITSVESLEIQNLIANIRLNLQQALIEKDEIKFSDQLETLRNLKDVTIADGSGELGGIETPSNGADEEILTETKFDDEITVAVDQETYPNQHYFTHPDGIIEIEIIETQKSLDIDVFVASGWHKEDPNTITNAGLDLEFDTDELIFLSGEYESDFSDLFPIEVAAGGVISFGSIWLEGFNLESNAEIFSLAFEKRSSSDFDFIISDVEIGNSVENKFYAEDWSFVI